MPEAQVAKLELGSGRRRQGASPSLKLSPRGRYEDRRSRSAASVHSFERPSPRIYGDEPSDGPSLLQGVAGYAGGIGQSISNIMGGGLSQAANGDKAKSWSRRKTASELASQGPDGGLLSAADLRAVAAGQARAQWDEDDSFTRPQSPPGNSRLRVF